MNLLKLKGGKKEPRQYIEENPFEALQKIGADVLKSAKQDVAKSTVTEAWDQFLNRDHEGHNGGEMHAGQEVDLEELKKKEKKGHAAPGDEYHREIANVGKSEQSGENREIQVKVHEILIEIKQLANSSSQLKQKVEVAAIEQMGENPGVYHLNFLEQALQWIRDARMNVEDSLAWFQSLRSKKAARQYGAMAKKAGTSFTLSNERTVATQTG
jgi:hypothetical protein